MQTPSDSSYREIPLTRGYVALVSAEDYEAVSSYSWYTHFSHKTDSPYAARTNLPGNSPKIIKMHRQILGVVVGNAKIEVDHINGNGLDNRRPNLRLATHAENMFNTKRSTANKSGFKGVHWNSQRKKWTAMISINDRTKYLGRFDTPEAAHAAYKEAALLLRGSFARFL